MSGSKSGDKPPQFTEWEKNQQWKMRVASEETAAKTMRGTPQPRFILPHLKRQSPSPIFTGPVPSRIQPVRGDGASLGPASEISSCLSGRCSHASCSYCAQPSQRSGVRHSHYSGHRSVRSGSSNAGSAYTSPSMVSGASASVVSERTLSRLTKLESALDEERQARVRAEQELEEIKNFLKISEKQTKTPSKLSAAQQGAAKPPLPTAQKKS